MKRLLIISAMLVFASIANAQTHGANANSSEGNDNNARTIVNKQGNEFSNTEISFREGDVIFSGLPDLPGHIWATVTNSMGDFVKQMKISPQENAMDIHTLHTGALYFITITYRKQKQKGLYIEQVMLFHCL